MGVAKPELGWGRMREDWSGGKGTSDERGLEVRRGFMRWEMGTEGTLGLPGIAKDCNWRGLENRIYFLQTDQRLGGLGRGGHRRATVLTDRS